MIYYVHKHIFHDSIQLSINLNYQYALFSLLDFLQALLKALFFYLGNVDE